MTKAELEVLKNLGIHVSPPKDSFSEYLSKITEYRMEVENLIPHSIYGREVIDKTKDVLNEILEVSRCSFSFPLI